MHNKLSKSVTLMLQKGSCGWLEEVCRMNKICEISKEPYIIYELGHNNTTHVCISDWEHHEYLSHCMTKPTKWHVRPIKTQISLGMRPVWSESSLSARRNLESLAIHWMHSEDSDLTGRMPRLIWIFAGPLVILVLSCCGSSVHLSVFAFCIKKLWAFGNPQTKNWSDTGDT